MDAATEVEAGAAIVGLLFNAIIVGAFGLAVLSLVLWIWALVDCVSNESSQGNDKVVWILMIILLQFIGAILYLIVRRPQRIREQRAMQNQRPLATPPPLT